jgi:hypothetical protein
MPRYYLSVLTFATVAIPVGWQSNERCYGETPAAQPQRLGQTEAEKRRKTTNEPDRADTTSAGH